MVARELTKLHEEWLRGPLPELAQAAAGRTFKGEIVIVIAPPIAEAVEISDQSIANRLEALLSHMRLKDAARQVADEFGIARKRVYDLALTLKSDAP